MRLVAGLIAIMLLAGVACGDDAGRPGDTGDGPFQPVTLTVSGDTGFPSFPPRPPFAARVGAYPSEVVTARFEGFEPGEARIHSTNPTYDKLPIRVEDDGTFELEVHLGASPEPEQHFIIVQTEDGEVRAAGVFVIAVLDGGLDIGLVEEALRQ